MAFSDLELFARIIKCEAGGEGDTGMRAVASVVMNRVETERGEYARVGRGDIRKILYQDNQFDCIKENFKRGYNPQNIYNIRPEQIHYDIAQWAMAGNRLNNLGSALWFFNPFKETCPKYFPSKVGAFNVRIGDHCFYNPTDAYYET